MKDFASFTGGEEKGTEDWIKEAETIVGQYAGKGEADIMRAIYARFSSMLDGAKRKRLKKLVDELKRM